MDSLSFDSSPEIAKLFEALSKAQGEIKPAVLDVVNPFYKSKYASLTSCQEAYKAPLAKYGLTLIQQIFSLNEKFCIRSILGHASGQWIANTFTLLIEKNNMQGLGSAITYGRRYGANSLIGVVDTEDDDGNASTNTQNETGPNPDPKPKGEGVLISEAQIKRLFAIAHSKQWSNEQIKLYMTARWGLDSTKDLDRVRYDKLIMAIETITYLQAIKELEE